MCLCIYIRYPFLNVLISRINMAYAQNNKSLILHLTHSTTSKYTFLYEFCATNINSTKSGNDCKVVSI